MKHPLRVLLVEDRDSDAELVLRELRQGGFEPEWERVETEAGFRDSLERDFDIILSDFAMPQFTGLRALELARQRPLEIPFILVSGTMGEETAVAAMKLGANDYLLKDRLARLGPAVTRALEQSKLQRHKERAQAESRESDERFRQLAENIQEVFWLSDPSKNQIHYLSPAYETVWGRSRDAVYASALSWAEAIHPDDRAAVDRAAEKQANGTYNEEYRIVRPDGSIRWIHDRAFPVRNDAGEIYRVVGVANDITERKRAEVVLQESERRFRELLENVELMALTLDKKGTVTFCNDHLLRMTGWKRKDLLGADWFSKFVPDPDGRIKKIFVENIGAEEIPTQYEISVKTRKGGLREIAWNNTLLRDMAGNIVGLASIGEDVTERKRSEARVHESEERMRSVLESALDCVITMDHLGRIVEFNPAAEKTFGYERDQAIGQLLGDLIVPPSLRDQHQRGLANYLTTGQASVLGQRVELMGMRRDHSEFPLELAITRVGAQEPPMFTGFIRDITVRKNAEARLREQADIINRAHDAIIVLDFEDQRIVFWNSGAERLYGWTSAEAVGQKVFELLCDGAEQFLAAKEKLLEEGEWVGEIGQCCKSGRKVIVSCSWTLVRDEKEEPKSVLAISTDVTERKRAEETIRQSESRLRALVTSMDDLALEVDAEGRYIAIWTVRDDLLSHAPSELLGRRIADLHGEQEGKRFAVLINRVMTAKTAESIEYTMDVVTGRRQFIARVSPIVNADGSCDRVCILSRDVTEQKKLEAQFLRAQRVESIGTLASGVAHDLNNILAPILMGAAVLQRTDMPPADQAILSTIETCAQRGADIVKQVLTFARGAQGEHMLLQPAHLIEDMAKIAKETFPKTITVRTSFPESLWSVEGDPTQLHQVLLNLSVNARDAMPAGGRLTISAENFPVDEHYASMTPGAKAGPHVLFEINDTGMGISNQIIDKIFDPFFTTKELGQGTGLGLSTMIGIVKSHGGFVSVYSEIGHGTTFKVYLPAVMGTLEPPKESLPAVLPPAHGELLLIVDDEKSILQVAEALLVGHGYRVLTAGDSTDALAIFAMRKEEIALVLTDLAMPLMDGIALIRTLQKMQPDVRIIASTGRGGQEQHAQELEGLNVRACLTKPYNRNKLLATLHEALAHANGLSDSTAPLLTHVPNPTLTTV